MLLIVDPNGVCTHRLGRLQRKTWMRNVETARLGRAAGRLGENGGGGRREAFAVLAATARFQLDFCIIDEW